MKKSGFKFMANVETAFNIVSSDGLFEVSLCAFCCKSKSGCSRQHEAVCTDTDKKYKDCGYEYCGNDSKVDSFLRGQEPGSS